MWHQKLCHILKSIGFSWSMADEGIYIKKAHNLTLIIMIYVNDLGLFTTSKNEMAELKKELKDNFTMTDLGEMKKILGIQVIWDQKAGTLKIMQGTYIDKILVRFNMAEANLVSTPLPKNIKLDDIQVQTEDLSMLYAKAIGSLMYMAIQT